MLHAKTECLDLIRAARVALSYGNTATAQRFLRIYRAIRAKTPASTLRRWKCGK